MILNPIFFNSKNTDSANNLITVNESKSGKSKMYILPFTDTSQSTFTCAIIFRLELAAYLPNLFKLPDNWTITKIYDYDTGRIYFSNDGLTSINNDTVTNDLIGKNTISIDYSLFSMSAAFLAVISTN